MILTFTIDYRTHWGESVYIMGNIPAMGAGDPAKALKMSLDGEHIWRISVKIPKSAKSLEYSYFVRRDDGSERREWGKPHLFLSGKDVTEYEIFDSWQDQPLDLPYYSVVFSDCICRRAQRALPADVAPGMLLLNVEAPMVAPDEVVAVAGNCDALGNWSARW